MHLRDKERETYLTFDCDPIEAYGATLMIARR